LVVPAVNLGSRRTSGIDFSIDYEKSFDNFKLSTNFSGGDTIESIVDTGLGGANGRVNRAGENTQDRQGAVPSFRGNLSETLTVGPASVTGQVTYVSAGKLDVTNNTLATNTINDNTVPAIAYLNLYGSFDVTKKARIFGAINNVLDRDPPRSPFVTLSAPINGIYYDKLGRAYQLGIDVKF
jgi:outer membrane receptor protein involved in Fe transport